MARNDSVTLVVPGLPPSSNHAVCIGKNGRRFPSKEYRLWKRLVSQQPIQKIKTAKWYGLEVVFRFPLFYKNGNVRRKDASNLVKYAEDECIKKLHTYQGEAIDDVLISEGHFVKVDSKTLETEITFYCI